MENQENQLQTIVQTSGLDKTKADYLLEKFKDAFAIASEWEAKAKNIEVTEETQIADMQIARIGRLALREKRLEIEKTRKELKEQSLREGKAIDGIANVLKMLIVPVEEYLDKQEHFIDYKIKAQLEEQRIEAEKKAEEERIAKEKADQEERERIRLENEKLKAEAIERERMATEAAEKAAKEKAKLEEKNRKDKEAAEKKLQAEREAAEKKSREDKARQDAILNAEREKAAKEKSEAELKAKKEREAAEKKAQAEREEKERLEEILKSMVECPHCHKKFSLNKEVK
jgi:hypothetical protein